ncbi:MAG TPA: protein-disulfide reductase DsbD family protein [Candidatus Krumholzibacteria bacterium]|nr:protein-disulfide reductase DsbD family protein [Candidatus Krumholzibacteria bacterium]HPD72243.1 protein-disulfide reductase DsbD family protein [Candidatus Krumholzibacteria bacterium]HRY40825.1 protein-disulfide reductase DsbD family protein [Candidatus Krumholzibacteria bacterium]
MRPYQMILLAATCLLVANLASAGSPAEKPKLPRVSADVVKASVTPAEIAAQPGGDAAFTVHLDIADTWHLYDHKYAADEESFYIGVDLLPAEGADLAGFAAKFPDGVPGEFMGEKVVMLHHAADILVSVKLPAETTGTVELPFTLTVQACDDKICLQPSDIPVKAVVKVE